jgi:hypothetical protein
VPDQKLKSKAHRKLVMPSLLLLPGVGHRKTAADDAPKTARLACAVSDTPLAVDVLRSAFTTLASTNLMSK